MILDMFNHLFPKPYFDKYINLPNPQGLLKRMCNIRSIVDMDFRFKVMDQFGDYAQIISLSAPALELMNPPDKTPEQAILANDGMAEMVAKHPKRFPAFIASLPMNNPEEAVKETYRSIQKLGACGIQIFTNVNGKPLDRPEFLPILEAAAKLDATVWLHPTRAANFSDYKDEEKSRFEIWWCFGWPYETTAAMSHIVFSGIFDKYPDLRIVTHHLGAMVPYFAGRIMDGWDQLGSRTSDADYVSLRKNMKLAPIDYFKKFYGDIAIDGWVPGIRCGLDFFGVDHVVFASDWPFDPEPGKFTRDGITAIESMGLSAADKQKIYCDNAIRLCKLDKAKVLGAK